MARQRTVAPGYFRNEALGECSPLARLLFAGLWCWADREGRVEDRPKRLKAEILPYDQADGEQLVAELERHGLVERYEAEGQRVLEVVNFARYQNPHPKESPSLLPARESHGKGEPRVLPRLAQGDTQQQTDPAQPSSFLTSSPSQPSRPSSQPERPAAVERVEAFGTRLAASMGLPRLGLGKDRARVVSSFARWLERDLDDELEAECVRLAREKGVTPGNLAWWAGWIDTVTDSDLARLSRRWPA